MSYAIIRVGGKQYRVSEGQRLRVDRLRLDESATFTPEVLFAGDGESDSLKVTARVLQHVRGEKIRIGKYRRRTGYRRHTGFRSSLSEIQIEQIGGAKRARAASSTPAAAATETSLPRGYEDMTVADIGEKSKRWDLEKLEAALAYERENAGRKGAITALESALERKREEN
ncbi:MAG: 50S ribosomal protein L21 [Gaiellaceae bacterium]